MGDNRYFAYIYHTKNSYFAQTPIACSESPIYHPLTTLQLLARVTQLNDLIRSALQSQDQECNAEFLDILVQEFELSSLQPLNTAF